jgi:hypothetical protein
MVSKTNVPRCSRNNTVSIVPSNNKTQDCEPKTEPFFLLLFPRRTTKTKLKVASNLFRLLTTLEISMKSSFLIDILGTGQPLLLAVMGSYRWRMMVDVELLTLIHSNLSKISLSCSLAVISLYTVSGWIKVSEEKMEGADVLAGVSGIHLGEAEAIFLAQKLGTELIIDEGEASTTSQMSGVRPIGTIAVLLFALAGDELPLTSLRNV